MKSLLGHTVGKLIQYKPPPLISLKFMETNDIILNIIRSGTHTPEWNVYIEKIQT